MRRDPGQPLASAYVGKHEALASLADQAAALIQMRILFRNSAPSGLAQVTALANFRGGVVVLGAANSAAAAKAKQLTPSLLALFREKGWQVNAIQIQVQPDVMR